MKALSKIIGIMLIILVLTFVIGSFLVFLGPIGISVILAAVILSAGLSRR
jgi:hypothetical protein